MAVTEPASIVATGIITTGSPLSKPLAHDDCTSGNSLDPRGGEGVELGKLCALSGRVRVGRIIRNHKTMKEKEPMTNLLGRASRALTATVLLLAAAALPAAAQYGGMGGFGGIGSGMGMGGSAAGGTVSSPRLEFRPWLSANGTYSEAMQSVNSTNLPARDYYGYGGAAGMSGGRAWTRTALAGFYTGSYQRYNGRVLRAGLSQVGGLTVQHHVSERVTLFGTQFAGTSNGGYGYGAGAGVMGGWGMVGGGALADLAPGGVGFSDLGSNGLVDSEAFGTRVNFTGTSGGISIRQSLRWAYTLMGSGSVVRRAGAGLSGLNSYSTAGQVSYFLSQETRVGAYYSYGRFSYPKLFGGNEIQQTGVHFSHRITTQTTLSLMAGGYQFRTEKIGQVAMDPSIAGLLGQGSVLEIQNLKRYGWLGTASLARAWRNWSSALSYNHGANPGNGVILASERDTVVGSLSSGIGRASVGAFGGYYRYSGLIQGRAKTESISMGGSFGIRVFSDIHLGLNAGYSRFETGALAQQWRRFASVHLTWSPSDAAFRF